VQPLGESAVQAIKALDDGRLRDAEEHIDAAEDDTPLDGLWRQFLRALAAAKRGDFAVALPLLRAVAAEAPTMTHGLKPARSSADSTPGACLDRDILRLAARALEHVGRIYHRQDRPQGCYDAHRDAYDIRNKHGSFEEVWESAGSLGMAADLGGRHADGQAWYRIAAEAGAKANEDAESKQASAWSNLSASLIESGLHDQAVDAARTAQHWWHKHDIGDVAAARADMNLGNALLKLGESLHDRDPARAKAILEEAIEWLGSSREALLAFGHEGPPFSRSTYADARWCDEQADFARRLRNTLNL
jgi:hypothetical protein